MKWGLVSSDSTAKVSPDGLSLEKTSSRQWMCAARGSTGWRSGRHTWAVKILSGADGISLGIVNMTPNNPQEFQEIDFTNARKNTFVRWDVYFGQDKAGVPAEDRVVFNTSIQEGTTVMLRLDASTRTLHYGVDGHWMKHPVFTNLPENGMWMPYFAIQHRGCSFEVIEQA
jgi:hypothetical protein